MATLRGGVSPEILQQIRDGVDFTEVVSRYVTLSKKGQNFLGLCPFHAEKTPSFSVNPTRQMFYCFGCGLGGDVFNFLMRQEGLGFLEAVKELARQAGVTLPHWGGSGRGDAAAELRKKLEELHSLAHSWFQKNLHGSPLGKSARDYLIERGIHSESLSEFGLGYALPSWDGLTRYLLKNGAQPDELAKSGLVVARDSSDRGSSRRDGYYDRFRGRVMVPIGNLRGQVIAFGGRALDDEAPKYLNSPETLLFSKGRSLFGFERARDAVSRLNTLILVEGYFDVIALHQAGMKHVAGTLGTALTKDQVNLVRRFTTTVVLIFDGDTAGVGAVLRALDVFVNSGLSVKVVTLPPGEDPDSFVRAQGTDAFLRLQEKANTLLDFAVEQCLKRTVNATVEDRARSVDDILRILMKASHPIEREEYTRQVAERLGVRQQLLVQRYPSLTAQNPSHSRRRETKHSEGLGAKEKKETRQERDLVSLLLQGELGADHILALRAEDFTVPAYRRLVEMSLRHVGEDGRVVLSELFVEAMVDEECSRMAAELTVSTPHYDDCQDYIRGCLEALKRKNLSSALDDLIGRLRAAEREHCLEEVNRLNSQIDSLRRQKAGFAISSFTLR